MRQSSRQAARLALAVVATPALLFGLAQPAHAATGSISEPAAGQTFTNGSTFVLRAQVNRGVNDGAKVAMTLQLPGSSTEFEVASQSGGPAAGGRFDLQYTYDPSCPSFPGIPCDGRPAPNGTHVIRLRGTSNAVERTFVMKVPPRRTTGVRAVNTGDYQITVRWDRGTEPDLAGYDVYSNGDSRIGQDLAPDTTEFVVNYPAGAEGEKVFYLVAKRRACPGCNEVLEAPRSDQATARIDAPPPPPPSQDPNATPPPSSSAPSPNPSSGGSSGGGSSANPSAGPSGSAAPSSGPNSSPGSGAPGGSSGAGSGTEPSRSASPSSDGSPGGRPSAPIIAQRQAFALTFRNFQPKLGAPKLPPLPNFTDPEVFEEEGTFEETLDFGEQDVEELVSSAQGGGSRSVVEEFVTEAFEGRKLWSSIGWSLILFLIAGHLRRWLNAAPQP
ncbi:MAG TPA: hypothetical protein VNB94_04105 [Mycobacteriales bacterium]|nr:hypothetical protein [Mycobacteriales bacterium]